MLRKKAKITNKEHREMTGLSDETVKSKKGVLPLEGIGRNTHCVLK